MAPSIVDGGRRSASLQEQLKNLCMVSDGGGLQGGRAKSVAHVCGSARVNEQGCRLPSPRMCCQDERRAAAVALSIRIRAALEHQLEWGHSVVLGGDVDCRPAALVPCIGLRPGREQQSKRSGAWALRIGAAAAFDRIVERSPTAPIRSLSISATIQKHLERLSRVMGGGGVTWRSALAVGGIDISTGLDQHFGRLCRVRPRGKVQRSHTFGASFTTSGSSSDEE
mmetsp:Transcript_43473/g.86992  ORF Transcript_43473/g.86992 Transcript_43473/m.86992 type:complete len:225 (-) Transcript_43473:1788-2462(-)